METVVAVEKVLLFSINTGCKENRKLQKREIDRKGLKEKEFAA